MLMLITGMEFIKHWAYHLMRIAMEGAVCLCLSMRLFHGFDDLWMDLVANLLCLRLSILPTLPARGLLWFSSGNDRNYLILDGIPWFFFYLKMVDLEITTLWKITVESNINPVVILVHKVIRHSLYKYDMVQHWNPPHTLNLKPPHPLRSHYIPNINKDTY